MIRFAGFFPVNVTTRRLKIPSKVANLGFCSKKFRNVLIRMKKQFSILEIFSFSDMVVQNS